MKITYTHGTSESKIRNKMIDYVQARGKVASFRAWVKSSTANAIRLGVTDGVGTTHSDYHTGSGAWERLVVTRTIDNASTEFTVFISLNAGSSAVFYVDNADCILADIAATADVPAYWSADPLEEKVRAERRYQLLAANGAWVASGAGDAMTFPVPYHTEMGGTPSITLVTTGSRTNVSTVTYNIGTAGQHGARMTITATGAGTCSVFSDIVAVEWNP